ncbi:hypothetical protein FB566_2044 [Stackebrandtia endophytica]|uniref:Uncharacterized protein n=2 Tax=Stackebrandtia endophytica TaxID=1496996 RepID=A0A543AVF8_9ACTN|nr:hypothetical protein FB566_2044 [Stackebrandtia endophytica]
MDGDYLNLVGEGGESRTEGVPYPTVGCMADIQETVFDGEVAEYHEQSLVARDGLTRFIIDNVDAHPEVVDLEAAWLDCMHDNGFPDLEEGYHPIYYAGDLYFDEDIYSPNDPRFADTKAAEIVLAQTDADCNREVGLDDTRTDIFWTVVEEYFHQFEVQLFTWTETVSQANLRAQNMLAE